MKIVGQEYGKSYNGYENTQRIIASVTGSDGYFIDPPYSAAAFAAQADVFPSGKKGYLPAVLEFEAMSQHLALLDDLMATIGGHQIVSSGLWAYWTSDVKYDDNYADKFVYVWCIMQNHGWCADSGRDVRGCFFVFRKLEK